MATGKTAVLVFTSLNEGIFSDQKTSGMMKLFNEGTAAPLTVKKDFRIETLSGAESGESVVDAAHKGGYVMEELSDATEFYVADCVTKESFAELMKEATALDPKKTLITIVSPSAVLFSGLGVKKNVKLSTPIPASSIAPTLALIADLPLPAQVAYPPAYAVLDGLDFKAREFAEMKRTMDGLMKNIEEANSQN
ncbi:hypothetical protein DND132_0964 [Pseudodesulfovibrio mercurii]|uniref:Uncharacterized protein n=1 Tax=Pseudodesulfovibrio mercurii TaxID=641491 RepID=F0JIC5_9BACT|nr:hypothetical protein [Pseudodesulfovibrio mercurii]EGB14177.1 hypothetical protein DND132_0964 [Pseudodesulfovibrio mercurii]